MIAQKAPLQSGKIKANLKAIQWRWVFGVSFAIMGVTSIALFFIISIFVASRSSQGDAPSQEEITQFSDIIGIWIGPIIFLSLTFVMSTWLAIKVHVAPSLHGLLLGLTICVFSAVTDFAFSPSLNGPELLTYLVAILSGWWGGRRGEGILKNREAVYRTSQAIRGANHAGIIKAIGEQLAGPAVVLIALVKKNGELEAASSWSASPNIQIPPSIPTIDPTPEPAIVLIGDQLPWQIVGIHSVLLLQLSQVDEMLLVASRSKNGFARTDIQNYLTIAEQVALSLENLRLVEEARQTGVTQERQRLAAEIHDGLTQGFISIVTHLEAAEAQLENQPLELHADLQNLLDLARQTARDNLTAARQMTWALRPDLQEVVPLAETLAKLSERWATANHIPVAFSSSGQAQQLHPAIETALLRTTREALHNIHKHAQATQVTITLSYMDTLIALDVQDNGKGFEPDALGAAKSGSGFGLKSMQEQAKQLGGSLSVESVPDKGTTIAIGLPIVEQE